METTDMRPSNYSFNTLLNVIDNKETSTNLLLICLKKIGDYLGITFCTQHLNVNEITFSNLDSQTKNLNLILLPIKLIQEYLLNLTYPLLIQIDNAAYVISKNIFGKPTLFNPTTNKHSNIPDYFFNLPHIKAWQCTPLPISIKPGYKNLLQYITTPLKREFVIACILGVGTALITLLTTALLGYLLQNFNNIRQENLSVISLSLFIYLVATGVFFYLHELYVKTLRTKMMLLILPSIWDHILKLPIQITKKFTSADLAQRFLDFETAITSVITNQLSLIFNALALILMLSYIAYWDKSIAVFYSLICLLFFTIKFILLPKNNRHLSARFTTFGKLCSLLNEVLLQITKIRSANIEHIAHHKWLYHLITTKMHEENSTKIDLLMCILEYTLPLLLLICVYCVIYLKSNTISAYQLLPILICTTQFSQLAEKFSSELISIAYALPGIKRIEPITIENREFNNSELSAYQLQGNLTLENVCLHEQHSQRLILDNISLQIKAGSFTAIIGASGAGKSTLFNLILGLESNYSGTIKIDDKDIKTLNLQEVRKQFGSVLQTSNLLPGSILFNIALNTSISLDRAWELAKLVGLDEEIRQMPMKMHTHISDNASESLSGGQRQKILLARALALEPKILLLDEATSALDNKSQALIQENLSKLNITRVVIAHRLSTIKDADVVYLMEKGRIVKRNRHCERSEAIHA